MALEVGYVGVYHHGVGHLRDGQNSPHLLIDLRLDIPVLGQLLAGVGLDFRALDQLIEFSAVKEVRQP